MQEITWHSASSYHDAVSAIPGEVIVLGSREDRDWGYFTLNGTDGVVIGYIDAGIRPQATCTGGILLIGINAYLFGIESKSLCLVFKYEMPWVFHEFVQVRTSIIVRDEIGFINLSRSGVELKAFILESAIDNYKLENGSIIGYTVDGEPFRFQIESDCLSKS